MRWKTANAPWRRRTWRHRFALFPTQVGEETIWLSWFEQKGYFFDSIIFRRLYPGAPEHDYTVYY